MGLLGGAHCIGMCGGIAGTLAMRSGGTGLLVQLAYNAGRISGYALGGLLVGLVGQAGFLYQGLLPVQTILLVAANILLIFVGSYLAGWSQAVLSFERLGSQLWQLVGPLAKPLSKPGTVNGALMLGLAWGGLPCGLVYSALAMALVGGSSVRGATVMIAFGLGTLPSLLAAGMAARRIQDAFRTSVFRRLAGIMIMSLGVIGLIRIPDLGETIRAGVMCFT